MKITNLASATVLIEANGLRILMDPWLIDGIYYGAWAHYPPVDLDKITPHIDNLDYVYVSHIHPDHCDADTMAEIKHLNPQVPVLIHRYDTPILRQKIERMGFEVIEIAHGAPVNLGFGVSMEILAADNCNPELCGMAFGCDAVMGSGRGSMQIDSMCVLTDGTHTLVNTNDCPYALSKGMLPGIKERFGKVDLLMVGYGSAGPYPQCYELPDDEKIDAAERTKVKFLDAAHAYAKDLNPRWVMPFAGEYTLCGKLWELEDHKGASTREEAAQFLHAVGWPVVLLNQAGTIDLATGSRTPYTPIDIDARNAYRRNVLATRELDYEHDPMPDPDEIVTLFGSAANQFHEFVKAHDLRWSADIIIELPIGWAKLTREPPVIYATSGIILDPPYVLMSMDYRLLKRLLLGPKHAHWNQAEIGSHIKIKRVPDVYERGLFRALHELHV